MHRSAPVSFLSAFRVTPVPQTTSPRCHLSSTSSSSPPPCLGFSKSDVYAKSSPKVLFPSVSITLFRNPEPLGTRESSDRTLDSFS